MNNSVKYWRQQAKFQESQQARHEAHNRVDFNIKWARHGRLLALLPGRDAVSGDDQKRFPMFYKDHEEALEMEKSRMEEALETEK